MSTSGSSSNSRFRLNEGDWICPDSQCGNVNFARRFTCNRCGKEKSSAPPKKKLGHEIGKAAAEKSRGLFSADDWQCGRCGNVNWASRQQCNMCIAPKFGEVEERTGLGGGYNERENVEYIEREESDGEFDDYGRKKKKFRKEDRDSGDETNDKKVEAKPLTKTSLSDDDGRKDASKYKLDSGEDEDDDDDDEDGDLSKYDLSGWGEEEDKEKEDDKSNTNNQKSSTTKRKKDSSQSSSSDEEDNSPSQKKNKLRKSRVHHTSSDSSSESSSGGNNNHTERNSKRRSSRSRSSSGSRKRSDSSSSSGSSRSKSPENKKSS